MDRVSLLGKIIVATRAHGFKTRCRGRVSLFGQTEGVLKVNGKTICFME